MDSDEDNLAPGQEENEVTLPRSTVQKAIKDMLPPEIKMNKEAQELVMQCCHGWHAHSCYFFCSIALLCLCRSLTCVGALGPLLAHAEYIHLVGSEANEVCENENRNMILQEHVLKAIEVRSLAGARGPQTVARARLSGCIVCSGSAQELGFKEQLEGITKYSELLKAEHDTFKAKAKIERKRQKEMSAGASLLTTTAATQPLLLVHTALAQA